MILGRIGSQRCLLKMQNVLSGFTIKTRNRNRSVMYAAKWTLLVFLKNPDQMFVENFIFLPDIFVLIPNSAQFLNAGFFLFLDALRKSSWNFLVVALTDVKEATLERADFQAGWSNLPLPGRTQSVLA